MTHIDNTVETIKGADGTSHEINAAYLDGKSSSTYAASSDLNDLKSTVNGRARINELEAEVESIQKEG